MKKRIILIPKDDIIYYPPTLSLINILNKTNLKVVCVGNYSDQERKSKLEAAGVEFISIYRNLKDISKIRIINWIVILWRLLIYKIRMKRFLLSEVDAQNDLVWFIYSNSGAYLQKYLEKFDYVVQFYEFEDFELNGKSRFLHPTYDVYRFFSNAKTLIHCEYNRAVITNGLYGLDKHFYILPNKPYELDDEVIMQIPNDVRIIVEDIRKKTKGKRVILYQGIFNPSERRLNEFCDAMSILPDNYVFIAMGRGGNYYEEMKKKYSSDKILFVPFIRPPYHLQITQLASIGVLTYHPAKQSYVGVLNPMYCAPNKIFEYGKFGVPMIANDVPGLKMIFTEFHCGNTISAPITPQNVADCVMEIESCFNEMSQGARKYYDSVDLEGIVKEILVDINLK